MKYLIVSMVLICLFSSTAEAQEKGRAPLPTNRLSSPSSTADMEQVNLDSIKEKYWARGDETELGVVQNRAYSKKGKVEVTVIGGVLFSDPFLDTKVLGGSVGYHFSEYLSGHLIGFKHMVSPSSALLTFQDQLGATTNTNQPSSYLGAEGNASIFYGKLSVLGKSIIYYDFHMLGGAGVTTTESGSYITPSVGLGQRFYISKLASVRLDYRLQYYRETLLEKQVVTRLGQPTGQRDNWSNVITLGVSFMLFGD